MKTTRPIFPAPAPPFSSQRLLFHPTRESDLHDYFAIRSDIEIMKWTSTAKCDEDIEATRTWMARFMPPNDSKTFSFSIEEKSNPGKVIGGIGCHQIDPPECGYMLSRKNWGLGYATEALKAFLPVYWALDRKTVDIGDDGNSENCPERLLANTDFDNDASRKVLAKCGFTFAGEGEKFIGRKDASYYLECPTPVTEKTGIMT